MWYKNIAVDSLDQSQSTRVTDRRTDRITTPKTALAQLRRAVKTDREDRFKVNKQKLGYSQKIKKEQIKLEGHLLVQWGVILQQPWTLQL